MRVSLAEDGTSMAEHSTKPDFLRWLSSLGPVIETHASWVVLVEAQALKFKKPLDLGFLDFSSREKREACCQRELELNRRLAPSVYQAVAPLYLGPSGYSLGSSTGQAPEGALLVDHAVVMRRLDEHDRADVLLGRGQLDAARISQLAERLVAFHAAQASNPEIAHFGARELLAANARENFAELATIAGLSRETWARLETEQLGFLARHGDLFEARRLAGHVRDGHGDLRLEHVYFEGNDVLIVDCIEFNDRFRFADTTLDLAFLSMDLRHLGRPDLAEEFLAQVAQRSGDFGAYAVVDFYESYRATVRGKVTALRDAQVGAGAETALQGGLEARAFLEQAERALVERRRPSLIAIGGLIASGKSTLARQLGRALSCPVIDTDSTRKRLHGVDPWTPLTAAPFTDAYSAGKSEETYAEVERFARTVLESGRSVVVDASFSRAEFRRRFRELGLSLEVPVFFIECSASDGVTKQRLQWRSEGPSKSDGRLAMLAAFRSAYEQIGDAEFQNLLRHDTSNSSLLEQDADPEVLRFLARP